jgi:oligopeptide/dipeptide ABC transporter ATP-binding protein
MPYTQALLRSIPRVDREALTRGRLAVIRGNMPDARYLPAGCGFHPRCSGALAVCTTSIPEYEEIAAGHRVRCCRWREFAHHAHHAQQDGFGAPVGAAFRTAVDAE